MQMDIFDLMYQPLKITKPIRIIEFFGGYGSRECFRLMAIFKNML